MEFVERAESDLEVLVLVCYPWCFCATRSATASRACLSVNGHRRPVKISQQRKSKALALDAGKQDTTSNVTQPRQDRKPTVDTLACLDRSRNTRMISLLKRPRDPQLAAKLQSRSPSRQGRQFNQAICSQLLAGISACLSDSLSGISVITMAGTSRAHKGKNDKKQVQTSLLVTWSCLDFFQPFMPYLQKKAIGKGLLFLHSLVIGTQTAGPLARGCLFPGPASPENKTGTKRCTAQKLT